MLPHGKSNEQREEWNFKRKDDILPENNRICSKSVSTPCDDKTVVNREEWDLNAPSGGKSE